MKRLHYACLLFIAITCYEANGQIEKGTRFWGGTIEGSGRFSSLKGEQLTRKIQSNKVAVKAQWGMFTKQNFMFGIGAQLALMPYSMESTGNNRYAESHLEQTYSLVPFVRWYKPLTERISFFVEPALAAGITNYRTKSTAGTSETLIKLDRFRSSLTVVPGISYRLGKRFALEADLNILSLGVNYVSGDGYREFRLASSVSSEISSYFGVRGAFYLN